MQSTWQTWAPAVEQVRAALTATEKGQPVNTIENFRTVFCRDPRLAGAIRLNLLTDRVDTASLTD